MKVILLDIDGVISIDRARYSCEATLNKTSIPNKDSIHRIHYYRPDIVSSLNNMALSDNVEVKFLSNWGAAASDVFSKYVGLENIKEAKMAGKRGFKSIDETMNSPLDWYKSKIVMDEVSLGNDVVFIDDKINVELALAFEDALPKNSGWIKTNASQGLTPKHMQRLRLWIEGGPTIRYHRDEKW